MENESKFKKIMKRIGLTIVGVMIAIGSWLLNNLVNSKRNKNSSKDENLKDSVEETKNDVNSAVETVDTVISKLEDVKESSKNETISTEERLDKLEESGIIRRKKK